MLLRVWRRRSFRVLPRRIELRSAEVLLSKAIVQGSSGPVPTVFKATVQCQVLVVTAPI